ncbi:MAG TPA: class I SAM-dependent methyltransferase [Candidatus Nanoarchaeia archaeon]|nr:class I SAM-dependent methyltransferase [Candidatus Nanoarchaeia archaeon]
MKNKIIDLIRRNEGLRKIFLGFSLWLNNFSYGMIKVFVLENGIHPKHRIMNYHQFFLDNIQAGETVLDIGCGNGAVAADLAAKAGKVAGIDIAEKNIKAAREKYSLPNLEFVLGDCLIFDFSRLGIKKFDKIILSNVLEHLDRRERFLQGLHKLSDTILLRAPLVTRDWLAVYKKEHGYKYKLSADHRIEYTEDILQDELARSGWRIKTQKIIFGEVWAAVVNNQ